MAMVSRQCVAVCCSVLQCSAGCCREVQGNAVAAGCCRVEKEMRLVDVVQGQGIRPLSAASGAHDEPQQVVANVTCPQCTCSSSFARVSSGGGGAQHRRGGDLVAGRRAGGLRGAVCGFWVGR